MYRTLAAALAVSLAFASSTARADQVTVVDVTYVHGPDTTHDSHLIVDALPATPPNLRSPIDYASGTTYVRLEVFTKPSDAPTRFQVCFNAAPTYACTNQAPPYTTTGVYTWETPFHAFWQGDQVDWSRGLGDTISLILKDTMNGKPSPENVGAEVAARYMPTRIRVTVTLVSPGDTYTPPESEPDAGTPDAGSLDAGIDAGSPDAGGADAGSDAGMDGGRTVDAGLTRDAGRGDQTPRDAGAPPPPARSGCSVAAGAAGGGWMALVLGLVLAARTRRRATRRASLDPSASRRRAG